MFLSLSEIKFMDLRRFHSYIYRFGYYFKITTSKSCRLEQWYEGEENQVANMTGQAIKHRKAERQINNFDQHTPLLANRRTDQKDTLLRPSRTSRKPYIEVIHTPSCISSYVYEIYLHWCNLYFRVHGCGWIFEVAGMLSDIYRPHAHEINGSFDNTFLPRII